MKNVIRGRFNAWVLSFFNDYIDKKLRTKKAQIFKEIDAKTIVELGPGVGANFPYYPPEVKVIGIEPNLYMENALLRNAAKHDVNFELMCLQAERLPFKDNSVDAIVATLVLCTVENQNEVLKEINRVLKPQGKFVCLEHIGAPTGSFTHTLQKIVFHPWKYLFEGCCVNRATDEAIKMAGFNSVAIEHFYLNSVFYPVNTQMIAIAEK